MTGAAAGKGRTEERTRQKDRRAGRANGDTLGCGGTGTDVPSKNPGERTQGLTDSSSATEAGEDRLNHGTDPAASLCSLERVVRHPPTEGFLDRRN